MERHHPFWKKNEMFQYTYCFGLGVMSMGHMKSITETQDDFQTLLHDIRLPEQRWQQIFFDLNNHFEEWIDRVFLLLRGKEEQYCFVLDLYRIMLKTVWSREYCSHVLEDYLQVFQFSEAERHFFENFAAAREDQNLAAAVQAVRRLSTEGYHIRYDFLTWFYPAFYFEAEMEGGRLAEGETLLLDQPMKIHGDIEVGKGSSLLIHGADLQMDGSILVRGGRFQADHARVQVIGTSAPFWLNLEETSVVALTDTRIDCGKHCGALRQTAGRLLMEECVFCQTAGERAISFSGTSMKLQRSSFQDAAAGMVSIEKTARAEILSCRFEGADAQYGGAVYSDTIHDVLLESCTFDRCHAKYLGAAVYFKYQKLGQQVKNSACSRCIPAEDVFFNVME